MISTNKMSNLKEHFLYIVNIKSFGSLGPQYQGYHLNSTVEKFNFREEVSIITLNVEYLHGNKNLSCVSHQTPI